MPSLDNFFLDTRKYLNSSEKKNNIYRIPHILSSFARGRNKKIDFLVYAIFFTRDTNVKIEWDFIPDAFRFSVWGPAQIKVSRIRIRLHARNDSCLIVACRCALFRYVLFSRIADKHPMKLPVSHVSDRVCRTHSQFRRIESFKKSQRIYLAARLEIVAFLFASFN